MPKQQISYCRSRAGKIWPPRLPRFAFRRAALQLWLWEEEGVSHLEHRFCPLKALNAVLPWQTRAVECHFARSYFTFLFRPKGVGPADRWWMESDSDGPIIALLLAELVYDEECGARASRREIRAKSNAAKQVLLRAA